MLIAKVPLGGARITKEIAKAFGLPVAEAERLKISGMTLMHTDMDRFTPSDAKHDITRFELNEVTGAVFSEILSQVHDALDVGIQKIQSGKTLYQWWWRANFRIGRGIGKRIFHASKKI